MVARMTILLYGPPGSGKSAAGRLLAESLRLPFFDLDQEIEARAGQSIPGIFASEGEAGFRIQEKEELRRLLSGGDLVAALGGGALLDNELRREAEAAGTVLCLSASRQTLAERLADDRIQRPLLAGEPVRRLEALLAERERHYASFPLRLDTTGLSPGEVAWRAQVRLGRYYLPGPETGCAVLVQPGSLGHLGEMLHRQKMEGPVAVVSDENVASLYAARLDGSLADAGYSSQWVVLPAGEQHKTMHNVSRLWEAFLSAGLERRSTVVALGGGVVSDLAGFAAATFLRGLCWAIVPTSLLAMVDASLGGKTGADLPQGKNLVGAFHSPNLVLVDPQLLSTLPLVEMRCGLAEVIKHCVIGDAHLFDQLCRISLENQPDWADVIRRSMAVKVQVIQEDPLERGRRAILNFGHTIGHAVETVSGFQMRHGEAVSIGMVAETRLAERVGLAQRGLTERIADLLKRVGLPVEIPQALDRQALLDAMRLDKKRQAGKICFSLPLQLGKATYGVEIEEAALCDLFSSCTGRI
jgi:shikimate kinase/3-dehydroquinate synthase